MAVIDNLISYWSLEEASGTRNDAHSTNHLTDNNTVTSGTGKVGTAASFAAASLESLTRATNASLDTGNIDFTFATWVNAASLTGFPAILCKDGIGANREYILLYDGTLSRFKFQVSSDGASFDGTVVADTFGAASTSTWYFVAAWHDSVNNQLGIAVNGGTADATAHSTGVMVGPEQFSIGSQNNASLFWNGLIDEVGFWKRVLTSDERTWLYNGGAGRSYANIVAGIGPVYLARPRWASVRR
jgi:hypothetical protein